MAVLDALNWPVLRCPQLAGFEVSPEADPIVTQVVKRVDLLQAQSKLARTMSLILFLFAIILAIKSTFVLAVVCVALSAFMLYVFFAERWEVSELVYKTRVQEIGAQL